MEKNINRKDRVCAFSVYGRDKKELERIAEFLKARGIESAIESFFYAGEKDLYSATGLYVDVSDFGEAVAYGTVLSLMEDLSNVQTLSRVKVLDTIKDYEAFRDKAKEQNKENMMKKMMI